MLNLDFLTGVGGTPVAGAGDPSRRPEPRNPGAELALDWVLQEDPVVAAVEGRGAEIATRRELRVDERAAWLFRAVSLMDLTTLASDDTEDTVRSLCERALSPLAPTLLDAYGVAHLPIHPAAVCVYHHFIAAALDALKGSRISVAAVSAGFPHGLSPLRQRVAEVHASVEEGATEIDAVIVRAHVLTGAWAALYDEVCAFRAACGEAHLKIILATGELRSLAHVARASRVCMLAGADFIKTSTGKEAVNATLPAGAVMAGAIRDYRDRTGYRVGLKPAGGIRTATQALDWMLLLEEELGPEWLAPELFRLGASSLLGEIERELERLLPELRHATG